MNNRHYRKVVTIITLLIYLSISNVVHLQAQPFPEKTDLNEKSVLPLNQSTRKVVLYFRKAQSTLEPYYLDNSESLLTLDSLLAEEKKQDAPLYIFLYGYASPEGILGFNEQLANKRSNNIKRYLRQTYPHLYDRIFVNSLGENWENLFEMVQADKQVPLRSEVLELLTSDHNIDTKEVLLKKLGNGVAYRYLMENVLPLLRTVNVSIISAIKDNTQISIAPEPQNTPAQHHEISEQPPKEVVVEHIVYVEKSETQKKRYLALGTNLLYDLLLLPNLSFELDLGNRWSVEAEGEWSWWNTKDDKRYFHRLQLAGAEVRKWLGNPAQTPFSGHYLGLYAMLGTYDVRFAETGYLSNFSFSTGVGYGYSKPIADRLNLTFGFRLGYFGGEYQEYNFDQWNDRYPWQQTRKRHYFGPTQLKIALTWLIGSGTNKTDTTK
jgi:hypothetical protein